MKKNRGLYPIVHLEAKGKTRPRHYIVHCRQAPCPASKCVNARPDPDVHPNVLMQDLTPVCALEWQGA